MQQAPPRLIPSPSTSAPSTSSPLPLPDMTPVPPPSTCAPDIQPTQPTQQIDYQRIIADLKADADFLASLRGDKGDKGEPGAAGVAGPAGPMGQNGMDGQDGQDAQLTPEHLASMTAAILQQLQSDPAFLDAARGPQGPPGEPGASVDMEALVSRIEALEQRGVPETGGAGAEWSHLVLLASDRADYWRRLQGDLQRAQGYYHQLRHLEPPADRDVGPLPLLVAYSDGKAVRSWVGLRNVTQAFSSISRGEFDRFIFAEGEQ